MVELMAECSVHGTFTISNALTLQGDGVLMMRGNSATCPRCGRMSPMMDGTFEFSYDRLVSVLAAPEWTIAKIKQMRSALAWAQIHLPEDPEEALRRIEVADPVIGSWMRRQWDSLSKGERIALFGASSAAVATMTALMTFLLVVLLPMTGLRNATQGGVSEEQVRQIVEQALEEQGEEASPLLPPWRQPPSAEPPATLTP